MPRVIELGGLRTRRDGTVILHERQGRFLLTRPGATVAARYYRGETGGWVVDLYEGPAPQLRAFVRTEALAEAAAAAAVRAVPTGLQWYDLKAVVSDTETRQSEANVHRKEVTI